MYQLQFLNDYPNSSKWMFPFKNPLEVICHNDYAPYNIVYQNGYATGIIDFDTAHPGPRQWDIAYALYRFAPFTPHTNADGFGLIDDQIERAQIFCQAYGLSKDKKIDMADLMIERLQVLVDFLLQSASAGIEKYTLNLQDGHHLKYLKDIEYIKFNKLLINQSL